MPVIVSLIREITVKIQKYEKPNTILLSKINARIVTVKLTIESWQLLDVNCNS